MSRTVSDDFVDGLVDGLLARIAELEAEAASHREIEEMVLRAKAARIAELDAEVAKGHSLASDMFLRIKELEIIKAKSEARIAGLEAERDRFVKAIEVITAERIREQAERDRLKEHFLQTAMLYGVPSGILSAIRAALSTEPDKT